MKNKIKNKLKKISSLKILVIIFRSLKNKHNIFQKTSFLISFFKDYIKYTKINNNINFVFNTADLFPRIYDKTSTTPLDPVYYLQNNWCANKIFTNKPNHHFDIGSEAKFIGIISQFTPTTMIDIRPLTTHQEGLTFKYGDILNLPFNDNEIKSLSSLCVIEHIGLGRYGDVLDPYGSEKSINEIIRVLADGADLYISLPVDNIDKIYFNAHRAFTREHIMDLFNGLQLIEEKYIYGNKIENNYDNKKGFGTGLFYFKK